MAERVQVSAAHDLEDFVWDYDDISGSGRALRRKCLEIWCAWMVLNSKALKVVAQVDVLGGLIHRVVDGEDTWEHEPALAPAYRALRQQVRTRLCFDSELRRGLAECAPLFREALSNRRLQPTAPVRS